METIVPLNHSVSSHSKKCGSTSRHRKRKKTSVLQAISCDHQKEIICLRQWMKKFSNKPTPNLTSTNNLEKWNSNSQDSNLTRSLTGLRIALFSTTGRGVMALKPIAAGDSIISIPRHLMVSCVDVCNDDVLKKALERTSLKFTSCELLAVFLLYHAKLKEGSLWKPYVESLPTMFHRASCQAEVELYPSFIASPLSCQLSILEVARRKISCVFKHIPGNTQNISPSDITWAYMAVNSRTVYLKPKERCLFLCPDDDGSCALAPFLDFLNHSCEASVSVELDVNDMYQIVTHVPYAKYDQIFISYGPHDNVKLFVEYGFFLPNNPHDGVPISMEDVLSAIHDSHLPDSLTTSLESKKSIASSLGEASNMFLARDGPSWSLTTVVKILLLRDDQIGSWQLAYEGANADNEAETRIIICIICSARQLLKDSLMKMMNLSDKSQHLVIGCTLVQEYVRLVDDCLAAYEKR